MATTTTHETFGAPVILEIQRSIASKTARRKGLLYPLVGKFASVTTDSVIQGSTNQGGYFTGTQGIALIKNNLRQLLLCEKGERIMLPDYGLSLKKYIFEPLDETTYFLMRTDILRTIRKYFKSVNVIKLGIYADEERRDRNELLVSLTLQLLDETLEIFNVEVEIG